MARGLTQPSPGAAPAHSRRCPAVPVAGLTTRASGTRSPCRCRPAPRPTSSAPRSRRLGPHVRDPAAPAARRGRLVDRRPGAVVLDPQPDVAASAARRTETDAPGAWRTTLSSASCVTRNAARSTSRGRPGGRRGAGGRERGAAVDEDLDPDVRPVLGALREPLEPGEEAHLLEHDRPPGEQQRLDLVHRRRAGPRRAARRCRRPRPRRAPGAGRAGPRRGGRRRAGRAPTPRPRRGRPRGPGRARRRTRGAPRTRRPAGSRPPRRRAAGRASCRTRGGGRGRGRSR